MHPGERIPGITRSALWNAWKAVRSQLKKAPRRDVLDYLEYDIDPDVWINRLLNRLKIGEYTPEKPIRYSLAKSKGNNIDECGHVREAGSDVSFRVEKRLAALRRGTRSTIS
jgi:hypothetical protein